MYVEPNFKTKKELKEAIKNGEIVTVYSPGLYLVLWMAKLQLKVHTFLNHICGMQELKWRVEELLRYFHDC